jgi:hypothetical protein
MIIPIIDKEFKNTIIAFDRNSPNISLDWRMYSRVSPEYPALYPSIKLEIPSGNMAIIKILKPMYLK